MIREGIRSLVEGRDLGYEEARETMREIMSGGATEAQIASFLTALKMKGETTQEISAFAAVMREFSQRIHPRVSGRLVDTCGTGGDRLKTFNISTISAFVVAGAGVAVAKHGNRAVTGKSGSADLLERLGLNLGQEPEGVEETIEEVGIGFMFAPAFHPAMKFAGRPRREIGIQTVFNLLGPLTNPAGADAQVVGVYGREWLAPLAYVLRDLGCVEAMVVHGCEGLDEVSTVGRTSVAWLRGGEISFSEIVPKEYGFRAAGPEEISGEVPEKNAELAIALLADALGREDPRRDTVLLSAAAGLVVGARVDDLREGLDLARQSIESGRAYQKLRMAIKASGGEMARLEELEKKYG